jgi:hypothetical protein
MLMTRPINVVSLALGEIELCQFWSHKLCTGGMMGRNAVKSIVLIEGRRREIRVVNQI